ncbi:MAG: type IX secretion system membrane protein PorP/SprF [Cyclobacteriaceae bacterium]
MVRFVYGFMKMGLVLAFFVAANPLHGQQNPQFTQYMFNPLGINPGYSGLDGALSLTFLNRQQWSGIPNAPTTQALTVHALSKRKRLGVGINLVNDKVGIHQNQFVQGNASYHLQTGQHSTLSMGMLAGINMRRSDYASILSGNVTDPLVANASVSKNFMDLGVGFYFKSRRFETGLSAPSLLPKNLSVGDSLKVDFATTNIFLFGKYRFPLGLNFEAEPSALVKYLQGVPISFDTNITLIYKSVLALGASYRKGESIAGLIKADVTSQFAAGYSYDYPVGKVSGFGTGSHEIMVKYKFVYASSRVSSPR